MGTPLTVVGGCSRAGPRRNSSCQRSRAPLSGTGAMAVVLSTGIPISMIPGTARVSNGHEIALGRGAPHVTSSGDARRNCDGFGMVPLRQESLG